MRIAYLSHEPLPSSETSTEQLVWTVSMLAREGLDIDLVIPAGGRDRGESEQHHRTRVRTFYGGDDALLPDAVGLIQIASSGGGDLRRAVHDVTAPFRARALGYDVVYTRDLYALSLALLLGMPSFFETYRTDMNVLRRYAPFRRLAYRHPRLLGIVTHSRLARDHFVRAGVDPSRLLVAHNGYAPSVMEPVRSREDARRSIGLEVERPLICYTGHVNPKKGVDILVPIAQRVPRATFLVVGAIPGSEATREFEHLISESGVSNVRLTPRVAPSELSRYLYAADGLIIPPTAGPLERFHRTVLPMKTYLYLAAGRPIVAPDLPDLREILTDERNAVLVPPDDVDACARAIVRLIDDPDVARRLSTQAVHDALSYTWGARARRIAEFLRSRLGAES